VADSGGPPAMGRWAGGASPPLMISASFLENEVAVLSKQMATEKGYPLPS